MTTEQEQGGIGQEESAAYERAPGFPATLLALVERGEPDDGVAYVGLLLERALAELAPSTRTITVFPGTEGGADPTFMQRGMFAARLISAGRRADCVLFNHAGVATARAGIPRAARRPYAIFLHGTEAWDDSLEAARRRALAGADLLIANSAYTARRVQETHPELRAPEIVPLALLPGAGRGAVDGALVGSITPRTIVIAGRMNSADRHRGHDELLECWQTVLARRPDARLAIVGRGGDAKRLEQKSNGLGLAGSVRFTGFVNEATLDAMLARAGAFARPSRADGFGLGCLRAMRAGVPCIAGADDAGPEVVEDGVTGMLIPSGDHEALAQAVIALLGDSQRRRAMGEAGKERYAADFTYEQFRSRLDAVMRRAFTR